MLLFSLQFGLCLPKPRMPRDGSVFHLQPGGTVKGVLIPHVHVSAPERGLQLITARSSRIICKLKLRMYLKLNKH